MPTATIQQAFDHAIQCQNSGRLAEAEAIYQKIVAADPHHADSLHMLGTIAGQTGRNEAAVDLIRRSIALKPGFAMAHCNLGNALRETGRLDDAIAAYRQAIVLQPDYAMAHNNLGNALRISGNLSGAIAAYRRATALRPDYAEAHGNLGAALAETKQTDEAIAACRQSVALQPNIPETHNNLGNALRTSGNLSEAIGAYRRAIALRPDYPEAHFNLGNALKDTEKLDEAIAAYHQAIALRPDYADALANLGVALHHTGKLDEAIAAHRQAIALKPNLPEIHHNLGSALFKKGERDEAIDAYRRAIAVNPNYPVAHNSLAYALLGRGNFQQGWEELEWRWKCNFPNALKQDFTQPRWDGCPLEKRTILLQAEQGFGDTLQFIRYLPLVARRVGKIIVECHPELQRLFQAVFSDVPVVARGQPLPAFDVHCPLLSLPRLFATDLSNIPQDVPYLNASATDAGIWRTRLADHSSSPKVGLVWAGNPANPNDRSRSLKLASLAPLAQVSGVRFFSLQKGGAAAGAKTPPEGMELMDVADELKDFADTAALITALDLVVTVDTSVAHLAGAMGRPVWVLLPFSADWRWLRDRSDSPWYPTMRLFRQMRAGDWEPVIARVREELQPLVESRRREERDELVRMNYEWSRQPFITHPSPSP